MQSAPRAAPLLAVALLAACASRAPAAAPRAQPLVRTWGSLRAVQREGQTEGRVALAQVLGPRSIAVGALAGLSAEITVDGARAELAEVVDAGSPEGLRVRAPAEGDLATLLALADVAAWTERALPAAPDLAALERSVRNLAAAEGIDVTAPFPFRVEGRASALGLHVFDHSCPIAHPDGPPPWRFAGENEDAVLVGFHAEDAAGVLTHHGQSSHVHALLAARGVSGHLDEVSLAPGARLFLPAE